MTVTTSLTIVLLSILAITGFVAQKVANPNSARGVDLYTKFQEIAQKILKMKTTWKAKVNPSFDYDSMRIQGLTNLVISENDYKSMATKGFEDMLMTGSEPLPASFHSAEKWPICSNSITEVMDQGYCGSCWAVSTTSALTDRLCIHSQGLDKRRISPQDILECCANCGLGCRGGSVVAAHNYAMLTGASTGGHYMSVGNCKPYAFAPCSDTLWKFQPVCLYRNSTLTCKNTCQASYADSYLPDKIKAKSVYRILGGEPMMMHELVNRGPMAVAFMVYQDFMTYSSGVYQQKTGAYLGGHAVTIIGYGVENEVKYWLCKNSWGKSWGDKGFFKIRRGNNEVMIESYVVGGAFI